MRIKNRLRADVSLETDLRQTLGMGRGPGDPKTDHHGPQKQKNHEPCPGAVTSAVTRFGSWPSTATNETPLPRRSLQ
jgi:hypothetical protein